MRTITIIALHAVRVLLLLLGGILMIWGALCLLSVSHTELQSLQGLLWGVGFIAVSLLAIWSGVRLGRRAAAMAGSADDAPQLDEGTRDCLR